MHLFHFLSACLCVKGPHFWTDSIFGLLSKNGPWGCDLLSFWRHLLAQFSLAGTHLRPPFPFVRHKTLLPGQSSSLSLALPMAPCASCLDARPPSTKAAPLPQISDMLVVRFTCVSWKTRGAAPPETPRSMLLSNPAQRGAHTCFHLCPSWRKKTRKRVRRAGQREDRGTG